MYFDAFQGEVSTSTVANIIVDDLVRQLNPGDDVSTIVSATQDAISVLTSSGNPWDAAQAATDIATSIASFFPQARVAQVAEVIGASSGLL